MVVKGRVHSKSIRAQKLRILMTNTNLKYFCNIMLGFPAAAVTGKSCLAQKQTVVAKKQTLESKLTDLTPGFAFLAPGFTVALWKF